ncbi:MAG: RNA polymerase sigma factor [Hyphomonadaceae bacterium]|jgi:RNA polymerase sigma-70 factor (ECF subfamily)|nr:RNA polymerase sigma factor [Hyphomonadaceae bacterium]MDX2277601.1 RNA polymerase sigma factor [Hyphomonadaceae bacterium]
MNSITAQPSALSRQARLPLRRATFIGGFDDQIARAQRGDRTAFSALMSAHKDDLFRFVRRRVADADAASDVVQEAFVAAWGAMASFDPERSFKTWLHAIALNKCRDAARRAATRRTFWGQCPDGDDLRVADERPSPEAETISREEVRILRQALATLPEHLREALMLTAVDGLSQAAASATLGCSVKSLEYRVHRARELLASEMARRATPQR